MRVFPFLRPALGLSIAADRLGLVEVRRGWHGPSLRRCAERALPAGVIRPSSTESNVTDVSAFVRECALLLDGRGVIRRPVPVSLSLPDLCARAALFEFDALPSKSSELDALIRWRCHKELNMPEADTRFTYQVFQSGCARAAAGGPVRILAVAIRNAVIVPYEEACELAGLIPVSVGLAGLQLFDLCRPVMEAAAGSAGEWFYLYAGGGSFAFLAIREGIPVFMRIKPLRHSRVPPSSSSGEEADEGHVLRDELLATLHFHMEHGTGAGKAPTTPRPLFLVNEKGTVPAPALLDALNVTVVPVGWEDLRIARPSSTVPLFAGLPALAGVMEA